MVVKKVTVRLTAVVFDEARSAITVIPPSIPINARCRCLRSYGRCANRNGTPTWTQAKEATN
jgi:hypothetical protein